MTITIRIAVVEDFRILAELGRRTFYETWKDYNTEKDMQDYLAEAFSDETISRDLADEKENTFFLSYVDGVLAGYAKMKRGNQHAEFNGESAIEVERVYVSQEFHRNGIGKKLVQHCIELAREEKFSWIWLGVNVDNHNAIAFYKSFGFEIFGKKMFRIGEVEDPDYLMKKKLV